MMVECEHRKKISPSTKKSLALASVVHLHVEFISPLTNRMKPRFMSELLT